MEDRLIVIATFNDYIEAEMARQLLADNGIEAVVTGQNASNMYQGLNAIEAPGLQVLESEAEKALEVLASQNDDDEEMYVEEDEQYDQDEDYDDDDEQEY